MEDRYPNIRFVIGAAPLIAGAVAGVTLLGGLLSGCARGGFAGLLAFVLAAVIAGVAWIATMVWAESLQLFVDLEAHARTVATPRETPAPPAA